MEKVKVLFCTPYNSASANNTGGIIVWSHNIMQQYEQEDDRRVELTLFPMDRKTYIHNGISRFKRIMSGVKEYGEAVSSINRTLDKGNYDEIHLSTSASLGLFRDFLILRHAKRKGIKSAIHFHFGRITQLAELDNWEWKLLLKVCKLATQVIVMDNQSYQTLQKIGLSNVVYLPNPVSPLSLQVCNENPSIKREKGKILFVGHVVPSKGVIELVKACKDLPDINLYLIGHVEEEMKLQLLQIAEGKEWLHIEGGKPYEEVIKEMLSSEIFVLPSYSEGFPNVILESMICHCPIVATRVGAIPEMLQPDSNMSAGVVVLSRQVENLRQAILKLLTDEKFSRQCADNAYRRVMSVYTPEVVYRQLESIWINMKKQ